MTPLPHEFQDLLKSLNEQGVEYLVIGGWAVLHYGYVRYTGDIDVWIAVSPENTERLARALMQFGQVSFDPEIIMARRKTLEIGNPPLRVHIMCDVTAVDFDACRARSEKAEWDGVPVFVISLRDLLENKRSTGRAKDRADVAFFTKYLKPSKRKKGP